MPRDELIIQLLNIGPALTAKGTGFRVRRQQSLEPVASGSPFCRHYPLLSSCGGNLSVLHEFCAMRSFTQSLAFASVLSVVGVIGAALLAAVLAVAI
jgi:hypothetical protein